MTAFAIALVLAPILILGYAYVGYPALLKVATLWSRRRSAASAGEPEWPQITITVPAYNAEHSIRLTLDSLLATDYPADRRHILVISDASTDRTDDVVREYTDRGVELLRLEQRRGKSAAENAGAAMVRGDIVVNTDAAIVIPRRSLKALVRALFDPTVGVASGRDVSVGDETAEGNASESGYVGYEMWVRGLETQVGSIVGASGCFYAFRRSLYDTRFPEGLSRDFASAMIARENGLRAVSVDDATCVVPRTRALQHEYQRKIRTMARGLQTLWYKRHLMNPMRYGSFALMLISHKLCRWLVYPAFPLAAIGLLMLSGKSRLALAVLALGVLGTILGAVGMRWPAGRKVPRLFAVPGFALASNLAGLQAWLLVLRGAQRPTWEPTKRPA